MNKRPYTDTHELIKAEVACHMRPFIEVTMTEHERTRKKIDSLEDLVRSTNRINTHDLIQYMLIGGLFVLMFLFVG